MDMISNILLLLVLLQLDVIASQNNALADDNGNTVNVTGDFNHMENITMISFSTGNVTDVLEGSTILLDINFTCKVCTNYTQIQFEIDDDFIATVSDPNVTLTHTDGNLFVASVNVTGEFFGYTTLYLKLVTFDDVITLQKHPIVVSRERTPLDLMYNALIILFLVVANVTFGCEFDVDELKGYLKKPIGVLIGLCGQYGFMPALAIICSIVGKLDNAIAFGLLAYGCSPGGGGSNVYTVLLGGDLNLSLTMTFTSFVFSFVFMPLWLYTVGQRFVTEEAKIPFVNIITFFIILVVPTGVGLLIRIFKRPWAEKIIKYLRPITMIAIIVLSILNMYLQYFIFIQMWRLGQRLVLPCMAIPYFGYIMGLVVALIFRQSWTYAKTISLETGQQNLSIPLILLRTSLPSPLSEISTTPVLIAALLATLPPLIAIIIRYAMMCCKAKFCTKKDAQEEEEEAKVNGVVNRAISDEDAIDTQAHQNNNIDEIKENQKSDGGKEVTGV